MMSTHELLELASLDALGLLDPEERDAFELAFRAAAPAVQAQIRREQARFANVEATLPPVEPPLGLRARVLAAVRDAMQAVAATRAVAGRIFPELRPVTGVSRFWRVAAIGAAAAAVVFGFTTLQMQNDIARINAEVNSNARSDVFRQQFGARFEQSVFDHGIRFVKFVPSDSSVSGKVFLLLDSAKRKGQLFCKDFAVVGDDMELVTLDEKGNVLATVCSFRSAGVGVDHHDLNKELDLENVKSLALRRIGGDGKMTILLTAIL